MKLSRLGEFGLIQAIQKLSPRIAPGVVIGIGDDAAGLTVSPNTLLLATTDMLIEDVHFDLSFTDFYSLGWKSAAVNVSDIAAMGGLPRFCLTSLGIPSYISVEHISEFYRGFNALLARHKTVLAGGDTCSSKRGLAISVTMLGEAQQKKTITRSGAKPGDKIFVTNTLGDSAAGLELLRNAECGMRNIKSEIRNPKSAIAKLTERHLRPIPRVEWGRAIALFGCASAMIDVSDGISSDLAHICEQSNAGAFVYAAAIPFSRALQGSEALLKRPLLEYALSGGEDYELLFTAPPAKLKKLQTLGIPVTEIGEMTHSRELVLINEKGGRKQLKPTGYNHFSGSRA
jgi:thiamine-monophosphate kinase